MPIAKAALLFQCFPNTICDRSRAVVNGERYGVLESVRTRLAPENVPGRY